jgi:hypothetical protein
MNLFFSFLINNLTISVLYQMLQAVERGLQRASPQWRRGTCQASESLPSEVGEEEVGDQSLPGEQGWWRAVRPNPSSRRGRPRWQGPVRAAAARPHTVAPARSKRRRWGSARAWAGEASGGSAETLASRPPARSVLKRPGPSGGRRRTLRW